MDYQKHVRTWIDEYRSHARQHGTFMADVAFEVDLDQSIRFLVGE